MAQPADRMSTVPTTKMMKISGFGWPRPPIHNAHNVGHSSSQMPMGRSRRMRRI